MPQGNVDRCPSCLWVSGAFSGGKDLKATVTYSNDIVTLDVFI